MRQTAVAVDECPTWAHRNSGHQWNAFLDATTRWIPFGGAETNPDEFDVINDSVKAPKIFRHTFSFQEDFAPKNIANRDIPPIFRQKNRIDVTSEYVNTSDITIALDNSIELNNDILYLAVFNADQWKIVSWASINDGNATFKQMGNNNIVYLPVFYRDNKIIPAAPPFILTPKEKTPIIPNLSEKEYVSLKYYNKFYDIEWHIGRPKTGWKMELFYWDNQWISCGTQVVKADRVLTFKAPTDGLYLIRSYNFANTWQRIFTIENGEQVWF
ncbi:hypothetical protein [Snuella lapsa]|uniref:Uncharacterized protein n=1 Tax=Snuella lapsa TaxID=870481 RepID=A0ABP6YGS4_9FLAO